MIEGFTEYDGGYDKQFYDVLLDGKIYTQVWPNGGGWRKAGLVLCSDENRTNIFIKESIIHPCEVHMENVLTIEEYQCICNDIEAYKEKRIPIAEAEYEEWKREDEKRQAEQFKDFNIRYISDNEWECVRKDARPMPTKLNKKKNKERRKRERRNRLKGRK